MTTARRTFQSFRYRNYRLFFYGQLTSQVGSWMQRIALAWYILELTKSHAYPHGSPLAVGLMAFAQFLPFTLFGLFAGVITDRLDARRLVLGTQAAQTVSAIVLTWLALAHVAQPWMLYTIAFVNGAILVLDAPSRQQLTYRMVGRDTLPNAIALNSSLFNASRILGPSVAGILLAFAGVGVCFLVNAVSFVAVLGGLLLMRTSEFFPLEEFERPKFWQGTKEGIAYVRTQPRMLAVLALTLLLSTFAFNFNVTLPVLAKVTMHGSAAVYGLLSAGFGAGALVGALIVASRARASTRTLLLGGCTFAVAELLLAPATNVLLAGVLLFLVGIGFTVWSANSQATLQLAAPDRLRGRIIGLYFYAFMGTGPFAGLFAGWLCARGGTELAFAVAGGVGVIAVVAAALRLGWTPRYAPLRRRPAAEQHA
ncbi:MAG TPA: MFS transporter [Gaiellaceae bacterium]|jgi:MFS family permease